MLAEAEVERIAKARELAAAGRARELALSEADAVLEAEKDRAEIEVRGAKLRADEAVRDAAFAVEAERADVAAREKVVAEAKAKREADEAHRKRILKEVASALCPFVLDRANDGIAWKIAEAIDAGKIPHVSINY